jgi:hypothetical protein
MADEPTLQEFVLLKSGSTPAQIALDGGDGIQDMP